MCRGTVLLSCRLRSGGVTSAQLEEGFAVLFGISTRAEADEMDMQNFNLQEPERNSFSWLLSSTEMMMVAGCLVSFLKMLENEFSTEELEISTVLRWVQG